MEGVCWPSDGGSSGDYAFLKSYRMQGCVYVMYLLIGILDIIRNRLKQFVPRNFYKVHMVDEPV